MNCLSATLVQKQTADIKASMLYTDKRIAGTLSDLHTGIAAKLDEIPSTTQIELTHHDADITSTIHYSNPDITTVVTCKKRPIIAVMSQVCTLFLGCRLYVSDGPVYSTDAALYVNRFKIE